MRKTRMEYELDGKDPQEVTVDGRDIRGWESQTEKSFIEDKLSYTMLTELAALAAIRTKQYKGDFDKFMAEVVNVRQLSDEDVAGDPTEKAPGDEPS